MHCEDAARELHAGRTSPDLELHLSACDECRLLSEDLAELSRAFARARAEWAPSPAFRVNVPTAPWRKLAIAACLLVLPLAGWAAASLSEAPRVDLSVLDRGVPAAPPTDREILATLFIEESRP